MRGLGSVVGGGGGAWGSGEGGVGAGVLGKGSSGFRMEADRNMSCQGGVVEFGLDLGSEYGTSSIGLE